MTEGKAWRYMAAQSIALAAMDVYATSSGDLRTIRFPVVGERMLPRSSLCVVESDKGDRARGLGSPSSVDSYKTPDDVVLDHKMI